MSKTSVSSKSVSKASSKPTVREKQKEAEVSKERQVRTVNKQTLLDALESTVPGLAQQEIVQQSTCFIFQGGNIITFNDETACRCSSPLGKKFTGAVQAEPLLNLLRKLQDDEITVEASEGELLINGKNRKAGIRMEHQVLLPLEALEEPGEWKKLNDDFCDAIGVVQACAGTDQNKHSMTCVHVHPKWVEAFDYFQMCRWRLRTGFTEEVLLRRNAIKHVASLGVTEFSETDKWVHFRSERGFILSCRRYTDVSDFPDISPHLNVEGTSLALPKGLPEAVEKAELFTSQEGDGSDQIQVELRPGRLKIRGQSDQGWFTEVKKIKYSGEQMTFMLPPKLLVDLVKKHNECVVNGEHLCIDTGTYRFVTCLSVPAGASGGESNGTTAKSEIEKEYEKE